MNPENVLLVVQRTFYDGFTYKCPLLQNCKMLMTLLLLYIV